MATREMATLYSNSFSNNALRVLIYVREKGLEKVKVEDVALFKGEHKQETYRKVNPRGQVPCLVDEGGNAVYESVAIVQYLEAKNRENSLYPSNDADLGTAYTRIHEFHQKLDPKNIFASIVFRGVSYEEIKDRVDALMAELKVWDGYLEGREYLANTFSIADIVVFPFFGPLVEGLGLHLKDDFPNLNDWYQRVKGRDSVKDAAFFDSMASMIKEKDPPQFPTKL